MEYRNFAIEIINQQDDSYRVRVTNSPAGAATVISKLPFSKAQIEGRFESAQNEWVTARNIVATKSSKKNSSAQEIGQALFNFLFHDEVLGLFRASLAVVENEEKGLRLKLLLNNVPNLALLPWEFLYDQNEREFVCLSNKTPIVRYLELAKQSPLLTITPPLKILGMVALPKDLGYLKVNKEKEKIESSLAHLIEDGAVQLTWLDGHRWQDLLEWLRKDAWHIFHFIGHGGFDAQKKEGIVAFADENNQSHMLSATELARMLANENDLRIVVLNSCEGGNGEEDDVFSSTASILMRRGIPAVLAMQFPISDLSAVEFSRVFYGAISDGLPIETAVTEARQAMSIKYSDGNEWVTPILHMRSPDGNLINFGQEGALDTNRTKTSKISSALTGTKNPLLGEWKIGNFQIGILPAFVALVGLILGIFLIRSIVVNPNEAPEDPIAESTPDNSLVVIAVDTAVPTPSSAPTTMTVATNPPVELTEETTLQPTPNTIAPVADDEIMVLVAEFVPIGEERDVSGPIVNKLRQTLEDDILFSNIRIIDYPESITSKADAIRVAENVGASVIVWGEYDEEIVYAQIQLGSLTPSLQPQFSYSDLAIMTNQQVQISDVRQESVADYIVSMIIIINMSANETVSRSVAISNEIDELNANLIGDGVSVHLYRYWEATKNDDFLLALQEIGESIDRSPGNPLLFFLKGNLLFRLGEFDSSVEQIISAEDLGPENWTLPHEALGFMYFFQGNLEKSIENFSIASKIYSDEWRAYYNLSLPYFLAGDYVAARENIDKAIALSPDVNWPYVFAIQIALREDRLLDAIELSDLIKDEFPDPSYGNRVLDSALGGQSIIGPIISATGNAIIKQHQAALNDINLALEANDQIADLYWMKGYALCNLGEFELAEEAYLMGIAIDPDFNALYLSRGTVRRRMGDLAGAEADFQILAESESAASYDPVVGFVEGGYLNCQNFLTFDPFNLTVVATVVPNNSDIEDEKVATAVESSSIYIGPSSDSFNLGFVDAGEEVVVNGRSENNGWLFIQTSDGTEGFVASNRFTFDFELGNIIVAQPKLGILAEESTLFSLPDSTSSSLSILPSNERVEILGRSSNGGWFFVRLSSGQEGFIPINRTNWLGEILLLSVQE